MALTNILREPLKEISETVVGLAVVGGALVADYYWASWLDAATVEPRLSGPWHAMPIPLGMIIGAVMGVALIFGAFFVHFVGETICGWIRR